MAAYIAIAENECIARTKFEMVEVSLPSFSALSLIVTRAESLYCPGLLMTIEDAAALRVSVRVSVPVQSLGA